MSAHQLDIISQARQGNPKALSDLLNRALSSKNIKIRAKLAQNHLTIFAEGNALPNQQSLMGVIKRGISDLGIDCLISVKVYGKTINTLGEGWVDEIFLKDDPNPSKSVSPAARSKSDGVDWHQLRQQAIKISQAGLLRGHKIVTDKRFITGSVAFVLLALLTTGGVFGFNIATTRTNDGKVIAAAQTLIAEANAPNAVGLDALATASEKLREARDILRSIEDARGSRYATAQAELTQVRESLQAVESRIKAEESAVSNWQDGQAMAQRAIQYVNTPPYPLEEWQKARDDLSSAIAMIGSIAKSSIYADQARAALAEYQEKLAWMDQGMANERTAMDILLASDNLARQAYDYTNGRYRFQTAELTQSKSLWQKAIDQTKTVPPTSNAYRQISDRISLYTRNLNEVDDKLRELDSCSSNSYSSQSFCNTIFLSLSNPASAWR
ncbi:MAG: hypothetical protein KME20_01155 [Kaiparowitsia implicata GSE-PSE-MK54-09C]|jgi:hypothetical protein|nr:hypothetical protein [Kaiparowitsia implicata GSE-PSE-MK54-09C]